MEREKQIQIPDQHQKNQAFSICPKCNTPNRFIAKFCKECGRFIIKKTSGDTPSKSDTALADKDRTGIAVSDIPDAVGEQKSSKKVIPPPEKPVKLDDVQKKSEPDTNEDPLATSAKETVSKQIQEEEEGSLETDLEQLYKLIDLVSVKQEVVQLVNYLKYVKVRNKGTLSPSELTLHYIFTGNPGTGKTTVARIIASILKHMGVLSKGHLVKKDREGLVGQSFSETVQKTTAAIDEAMGGILFIDQACALMQERADNDSGKKVMDILAKRLVEDRGKFIVIASDDKNKMDRLIDDPVVAARFRKTVVFEDYTPDKLFAIFENMMKSKKMTVTPQFTKKLKQRLDDIYAKRDRNFANGQIVRDLFEAALRKQSTRIAEEPAIEDDERILNTLEAEDLP
jgi:stage V sporulation protein K